MVVKVVTDSSSDLPPETVRELGITVVPLYIRLGDETYRDGVDITPDQFYEKLGRSRRLPRTSIPSPGDFARVYQELAAAADGILSIHLSPRYSGAINAATVARGYAPEGCPVEVLDSRSVSMGCGFVVMAAARAAREGANLAAVMEAAGQAIKRTHIVGMIADIHYLLGGRRLSLPGWHLFLGRLGTVLRFKLVGEIYEAGKVRGRGMFFNQAKALARLEQCLTGYPSPEEIAVLHARQPEWAKNIADRLVKAYPGRSVRVSRLSAATGSHGGPRAVAVAFIESASP
ncbi:MAG TPA: DegV family protein [Dehalococcoidales bacterium]|nr:DegV family protein [Dehalococcoidales bacterium]